MPLKRVRTIGGRGYPRHHNGLGSKGSNQSDHGENICVGRSRQDGGEERKECTAVVHPGEVAK